MSHPSDDVHPREGPEPGTDAGGTFRPSRRHLLAVAAWSVPVILVAQAIPAAASDSAVTFTGTACKHPGNSHPPFHSDYHFELRIRNTAGGSPLPMTITSVVIGPSEAEATARTFSTDGLAPVNSAEKTFSVSEGTAPYIIHAGGDNSSNSLVYARVDFRYGSPQVPGWVTSFTLTSGPCGEAQKN